MNRFVHPIARCAAPALFSVAVLLPALLPVPTSAGAAETAAAALPAIAGEVRRVDAEKQRITLKHGAITNLDMPPMTMSFRVADAKLLAGLKTGDAVKFAAKMADGDVLIVRLEKTP